MKFYNKNKGFTLGEILVTLAIVGTISALTMPSLIANYQKTANVTKLRKIYVEMGQAIDLLMTDEGKSSLASTSLNNPNGDLTHSETAGKFLKTYLNVAKDCGENNDCFASSYIAPSGGTVSLDCGGYSVITSSGYTVCMREPHNGYPAFVIVDVNGPDKPNSVGRDAFSFDIYNDGSIDEKVNPHIKRTYSAADLQSKRATNASRCYNNSTLEAAKYAAGCFTRILNSNWKMDY